jgi:beta-glucosidase
VLQVWFAGQEMGPALADVLLGDADPGGRLPHTVPVRLEDHPAHATYPGSGGRLRYEEGVRCGHRWYDAQGIAPRFPFGHGMSYASFEWGDVSVEGAAPSCTVRVPVTNTSARRGSDVVQVYVTPPAGSGRPERELKGFAKVDLEPGASAQVEVALDDVAFRRWSDGGWTVDPGVYRITVGASSRDLRTSVDVTI